MNRKIPVSFAFLVMFFLMMGVAFSEGLFDKNAIDFNPDVSEEPEELFIPLGFDQDQKFSYLYKQVPENVGCTSWALYILNLSNDRVLVNKKTPFHDCYEADRSFSLDDFEPDIKQSLVKHKIVQRDMTLKFFPLKLSDRTINACVSKRNGVVVKETVKKYKKDIIIFDPVSNKAKIIAEFTEVEFSNVLQTYAPKIEGYFQNTTTGRLAVLVSYSLGSRGGQSYIRRVEVYGSTLQMKENKDLISMCDNDNIDR